MNVAQRVQRLEGWLSGIERTLGRPVWNGQDFVYNEVTVAHVAFLKAVRAISSLHALPLLYGQGLIIDGNTIVRCINEALSEIHFLLEDYPATTDKVKQLIEHFMADSPTPRETQPKQRMLYHRERFTVPKRGKLNGWILTAR
jgi:hypothetical protein